MRKFSWYLNKVWNLGHNNEDADFDWWEWYGLHPVKRLWKRTMGSHIKELAGNPRSLISLGCGSSPIINLFGSRVVGVDMESSKVDFMEAHSSATFIAGDITKDLGLGKFKVVLCNEVLEHLTEGGLDLGVSRVVSYADPGGRLVVSFPDYGCWYGRLLERLVHGSLHSNEFTKADLVSACGKQGWYSTSERRFLWDTVILFRKE